MISATLLNLLPYISGGLQMLSTWKGTRDASRQNQKTQQLIDSDLKQAETDRKITGDNYLDTTEGKALATQALNALREATMGASNTSIKSNETTAQRLARQSQAQKTYSNIIQQLASRSTQYKQNADALLNRARREHTNAQTRINNMAAQSDVNSGIGVAQGIGDVATATMLQNQLGTQNVVQQNTNGRGMSANDVQMQMNLSNNITEPKKANVSIPSNAKITSVVPRISVNDIETQFNQKNVPQTPKKANTSYLRDLQLYRNIADNYNNYLNFKNRR